MKSIKLILITIIGLFLTANVFGQLDNTDGTHKNPHIVAKNSKYTYNVKLNTTTNFNGVTADNFYVWEIFASDGSGNVTGSVLKQYQGTWNASQENTRLIEWLDSDAALIGFQEGKEFIVRVTEYSNHSGEADDIDMGCAYSISEITVRIGADLQIYLSDPVDKSKNKDYFQCSDNITGLDFIDTEAGLMEIKTNGRPGNGAPEIAGWNIEFEVTKKVGGVETVMNVIYNAASVPQDDDGFYTINIGLQNIQGIEDKNDNTKSLNIDYSAPTNDVYYKVKVVEVTDGDSNNATFKNEANKKDYRLYGFYTKPKVTQINFK